MPEPVTAVTFDFWNTIARSRPGTITEARRSAVEAACRECSAEVEAELLASTLAEVARRQSSSWELGEHFHPREGAEMLADALGLEGAARRLVADAFLGAAGDLDLDLSPGIGACLEQLRGRGIRLGIVCDVGFTGGELLRAFLAREGLLEHFDGWAFSDEVGHYKPSAPIFEAALGAFGAAPAASAHVGDLRRTDVAGAAAIGMRTVRYRGLHDDPAADGAPEADHVLDSHHELPDLLDRLGR